jgi:hypothetical protein
VGRGCCWCGQNPDLGVPTPRPPVERRNAAPQTPLRKVRFVGRVARFALVLNVIDLWVGFIDRIHGLGVQPLGWAVSTV